MQFGKCEQVEKHDCPPQVRFAGTTPCWFGWSIGSPRCCGRWSCIRRRLARLPDGANGFGQHDRVCVGNRARAACDPLAAGPVPGTNRECLEAVERNSGLEAVDANDGWFVHRGLDRHRNAAVRRSDKSVYSTCPVDDCVLRGPRRLRRLDQAEHAPQWPERSTEICRSSPVRSGDRIDPVLAATDRTPRTGTGLAARGRQPVAGRRVHRLERAGDRWDIERGQPHRRPRRAGGGLHGLCRARHLWRWRTWPAIGRWPTTWVFRSSRAAAS